MGKYCLWQGGTSRCQSLLWKTTQCTTLTGNPFTPESSSFAVWFCAPHSHPGLLQWVGLSFYLLFAEQGWCNPWERRQTSFSHLSTWSSSLTASRARLWLIIKSRENLINFNAPSSTHNNITLPWVLASCLLGTSPAKNPGLTQSHGLNVAHSQYSGDDWSGLTFDFHFV